jgi:hypothetical protein
MLPGMKLYRRYTIAYARRRLASIDAQIAYWHAKPIGSDWRLAAAKARALASLEAERPRFDRIVNPRVESEWRLPF